MTAKKCLGVAIVALLGGAAVLSRPSSAGGEGQAVSHRAAVEITTAADGPDEAVLGRPLALAFDADRLLVADALDCAIKVFSREGRFIGSFGRKGSGPGELSFPSGVCFAGKAIAVADKFNFRIQIFDGEGGARGGFKLPFPPDKVLALDAGRLLVTGNPTGRGKDEKLLHIYDIGGDLIWEGLAARTSADAVLDAFRNMILVCPGEEDDLYVIFRSGGRAILHYSGSGDLLGAIDVDERHASRILDLPSAKGGMRLEGFCWAAARDAGWFYLAAPEALGGRDLGPGRAASVIDGQGRLRAVVELPCAVHRFVVAEGRMFAIDEEGALRIFEVGR